MEPQASIWDDIMYPTALFASARVRPSIGTAPMWEQSLLNPKNRIESLDADQPCSWRIDGAETEGTRFFAVPNFAIGKRPLRIDVYIPDQNTLSEPLRQVLETRLTMLVPSSQAHRLAVSHYLLRVLDYWSSQYPDFEAKYMSMPYGSRIVVDKVLCNIQAVEIHFLPSYEVERQWLSLSSLHDMWCHLPSNEWPETLDIGALHFHYQLHDAIALVHIPHRSASELYVFKSLTQDLRHMYHEINTLLTMQPHDNIISKPLYLITSPCRFGGKIGVCGFILPYHRAPNLRDALRREIPVLNSMDQRIRAAKQLTSAILHIQRDTPGFYSDLKLQNILIATSDQAEPKIILLDFEQRGGWFSWSPPEIYCLDYIEYLANYGPTQHQPTYRDKMREFVPGWKPRPKTAVYVPRQHGYSTSWNNLHKDAREPAVVFMLGKVLWCLLEGVGSMSGMVLNPEAFRDEPSSDIVFPEFKHTPWGFRDWIRRCTAGAPEWDGNRPCVVLKRGKLYPYGKTGDDKGEEAATGEQTQAAATAWWMEEMDRAERFLYAHARRRVGMGDGCACTVKELRPSMWDRPKLEQVLVALEEL